MTDISQITKEDLNRLTLHARNKFFKLGWIRKQQTKLSQQAREPARDFVGRESHYYLGKRYLLKIYEIEAAPKVALKHSTIEMQVRPGTSTEKRETIIDDY